MIVAYGARIPKEALNRTAEIQTNGCYRCDGSRGLQANYCPSCGHDLKGKVTKTLKQAIEDKWMGQKNTLAPAYIPHDADHYILAFSHESGEGFDPVSLHIVHATEFLEDQIEELFRHWLPGYNRKESVRVWCW